MQCVTEPTVAAMWRRHTLMSAWKLDVGQLRIAQQVACKKYVLTAAAFTTSAIFFTIATGGQGWRILVLSATPTTATIRFTHARHRGRRYEDIQVQTSSLMLIKPLDTLDQQGP